MQLLYVFVHDSRPDHPVIAKLEARNIPIFLTSEGVLKKITDTSYLIPVVGVAALPPVHELNDDFAVVLDNVVDFGNIGTIVRTAAAFGVKILSPPKIKLTFFTAKLLMLHAVRSSAVILLPVHRPLKRSLI